MINHTTSLSNNSKILKVAKSIFAGSLKLFSRKANGFKSYILQSYKWYFDEQKVTREQLKCLATQGNEG